MGLLIKFRKRALLLIWMEHRLLPTAVLRAGWVRFVSAINIRGIYRVGSLTTAESRKESYVNYRCEGFTILPFNSRGETGRSLQNAKIIFLTVVSNFGKKINKDILYFENCIYNVHKKQ